MPERAIVDHPSPTPARLKPVCATAPAEATLFDGGSGTEDDPLRIVPPERLLEVLNEIASRE